MHQPSQPAVNDRQTLPDSMRADPLAAIVSTHRVRPFGTRLLLAAQEPAQVIVRFHDAWVDPQWQHERLAAQLVRARGEGTV